MSKAFQICYTLCLLADLLECEFDDGKALNIFSIGITKPLEAFKSFLFSSLIGQPPWAFGHEEYEACNNGGEAILCAEDGAVSPSSCGGTSAVEDEGGSQWSDGIGHSNDACQQTTQDQGGDFSDIGNADSSERTDGEAIEELPTKELFISCGDELQGHGSVG